MLQNSVKRSGLQSTGNNDTLPEVLSVPLFGVKACAHSQVDPPSSGSNCDDLYPGLEVASELLSRPCWEVLSVNKASFDKRRRRRKRRRLVLVSGLGGLQALLFHDVPQLAEIGLSDGIVWLELQRPQVIGLGLLESPIEMENGA